MYNFKIFSNGLEVMGKNVTKKQKILQNLSLFQNVLEPRFAHEVLQKSNTGFGFVIFKMSKTRRKMLCFLSS